MAEWTVEAIGQLRALWVEGHSAAEIGRRVGFSKNSVVGKANRLGLPARPSPIQPRKPPGPARNPKRTLQEPIAASGWRVPKKAVVTPKMLMGRDAVKVTLPVEAPAEPVQAAPPKPAAQRDPAAPSPFRKCQFPLWGEGRPTQLYCSAPTVHRADGARSSWCVEHYRKCHTTHAAYGYALPAVEKAA